MDIREYVTKDGKVPFSEWLNGLRDRRARARIRIRLDRVRLGNLGDYRALQQGVYELRIAYGPGYRIYFAFSGEEIVLLLAGGDKRSQQQDINKAKSYWADFRGREDGQN